MEPFDQFVTERKRDLQRISRHSRLEYGLDDVIGEAWLEIWNLQQKGHQVDLTCKASQDLLVSHLYQRLVRYTDLKVRHGVRLDQADPDDEVNGSHWLSRTLVSDDGEHPSTLLERMQESSSSESGLGDLEAGAYVVLMRRFGNSMRAVASYLLISRSHAYRCCSHARMVARCQHGMKTSDAAFVMDFPRPWRRARFERVPVQLSFSLDDELPLGAHDVSGAASNGARMGQSDTLGRRR